jgi:hypothetical protein
MLNLLLQQLYLVCCETEKAIDPVVQFGLGVGESTCEASVLDTSTQALVGMC